MTTRDKLSELRVKVEEGLKHRGMNLALVIFGLVFVAAFLLFDVHQRQTFLPEIIVVPLHAGMVVFGVYFAAAIVIRLTADLVIRLLRDAEIEYRLLLRKAYIGSIYAIATLFLLWRFGLSVQNLTILVGFMATGLAFAVRDIVIAFLAWYVLLVKRPFRIGDCIKIGDEEGKVMHIGTFFVLIDNSPQTHEDFIRIPGKTFLEKPVYNYGPGAPLCTWKVRLSTVPSDAVVKRAAAGAKRASGVAVQARLDADAEGPLLNVSFRAPYDVRGRVKEAFLRALPKGALQ